jgi:hypothetical protein
MWSLRAPVIGAKQSQISLEIATRRKKHPVFAMTGARYDIASLQENNSSQ